MAANIMSEQKKLVDFDILLILVMGPICTDAESKADEKVKMRVRDVLRHSLGVLSVETSIQHQN